MTYNHRVRIRLAVSVAIFQADRLSYVRKNSMKGELSKTAARFPSLKHNQGRNATLN